ncbi:DUF397 domain-containing protein [Streptomyces paludis]|uniref:DUF397 domain-containing protein n=1 Tax=Streptomyces paludis TaxID=2282738 RepID=A0A345HTD9_9ACTN|nr:DUF397 domain-containing protein [Streptomyces paludis]AXG79963.1 DUF397 domain-containing protein [Streptomyces paludis]
MSQADSLTHVEWRKSSFSGGSNGGGGECLETAFLSDGRVAVRDSKIPSAGALVFSRTGMAAWLAGVKAGRFDSFDV